MASLQVELRRMELENDASKRTSSVLLAVGMTFTVGVLGLAGFLIATAQYAALGGLASVATALATVPIAYAGGKYRGAYNELRKRLADSSIDDNSRDDDDLEDDPEP